MEELVKLSWRLYLLVLVILTLTITQQGEKPMVYQDETIQEVQSKNKAKAFEEQKEMRKECADFVKDCSTFHLQEIHSEIKRLKNYRKDRF